MYPTLERLIEVRMDEKGHGGGNLDESSYLIL